MSIFDRLTTSPQSFADADLLQLMKMYEGRRPRGRNARLPVLAFLEYERRHPSPIEKV